MNSDFREDDSKDFLYRRLVHEIEQKILDSIYQPGEKLPSVRILHRRLNLSISTVYRAFVELESKGLIEARPRSGYYVAPVNLLKVQTPLFEKRSNPPGQVRLSSMINSVVAALNNAALLPLASTVVDTALLPVKPLNGIIKSLSVKRMQSLLSYSFSEGLPELRRQLAMRMLGVLEGVAGEDIIITNGCTEAVTLALLATVKPGDTVAIETPANFSFLQLLKELGLLVAEVPTDPVEGVDLAELATLLKSNAIKACLFIPNFQNPLGALMPDDKKKALVAMLNEAGIPIIEDDISGEIYFTGQRPLPLKVFDRRELVLTCSSFSKTLAPGMRVGWIIPGGRLIEKVRRLKAGISIATSTLDQYLAAKFLAGGGYDRHLRTLRGNLRKQALQTAWAVQKYFPPDTRFSIPRGGSLFWIQLPPYADGLDVYRRALDHNISLIPGEVCSSTGYFKNHIQLSFGLPFSEAVENGIQTLGRLVTTSLEIQDSKFKI